VSVRRGRTRPTSPVDDGAAGENRPLTWGPFGDHTLYAMVNDLRVCARLARPHFGHTRPATRGYGLARFTGGQVVAGSNPASPTLSARLCQPDYVGVRPDPCDVSRHRNSPELIQPHPTQGPPHPDFFQVEVARTLSTWRYLTRTPERRRGERPYLADITG
jgi:hypothetical protein